MFLIYFCTFEDKLSTIRFNNTVIYFEIYFRCFLLLVCVCVLLSCPFSNTLGVKLISLQKKSNEVKDLIKEKVCLKKKSNENFRYRPEEQPFQKKLQPTPIINIHHSTCRFCVMPKDAVTGNREESHPPPPPPPSRINDEFFLH